MLLLLLLLHYKTLSRVEGVRGDAVIIALLSTALPCIRIRGSSELVHTLTKRCITWLVSLLQIVSHLLPSGPSLKELLAVLSISR